MMNKKLCIGIYKTSLAVLLVVDYAFIVVWQLKSWMDYYRVGCCAPDSRFKRVDMDDLADLPTTEKLDGGAKIKGKIAVIEIFPNSNLGLEGFYFDGTIDRSSALKSKIR